MLKEILIIPISKLVNDIELMNNFSNHLKNITTSEKTKENYGVFFRLFSNSFIWFDIEKFQEAGSPLIFNLTNNGCSIYVKKLTMELQPGV